LNQRRPGKTALFSAKGDFMVDFALVPERTALMNVDMHNCFVERTPFSAPDGLIVQHRINRVAAAGRPGIPVIHARAKISGVRIPEGTASKRSPICAGAGIGNQFIPGPDEQE
jgi:nicotinamidase-related amidase